MKPLFALLLLLLFAAPSRAEQAVPPWPSLKLERAMDVVAAGDISGLQPSGLAFCQGRLLMVSDRHNQDVFALNLIGGEARVETFVRLQEIPEPDLRGYGWGARWWHRIAGRYDWEGISCDQQGNLYLLSESLTQVLRRSLDGTLTWLGGETYLRGREKGLFEQSNALAEGLALDGETLMVAAERQPRGLVRLERRAENHWRVASVHYLSGFPSLFQPQDFAGLWMEGGRLYTLERNHFQLCRRVAPRWQVQRCWGYEQVEKDPRWKYRDQRFGKAEGVARQGSHLYVVLDNNGRGRASDESDRRPLLFQFELPDSW